MWAGLSKGDYFLPGIHPTEEKRFDIHRKSLRPEVVKIDCQFSKGLYKIIEMVRLQKYA